MGIVRALADIEAWLDVDASHWTSLSDREYKALVCRWSQFFSPLIAADRYQCQGRQAILSLESRLPSDVFLFNGLQVPQLANLGGRGAPAAYQANGLQRLRRGLANSKEFIIVADDFAWSCVFTHEAGGCASERMYDRDFCV